LLQTLSGKSRLTLKKRLCYRSNWIPTRAVDEDRLKRFGIQKNVITGYNTDVEHDGVVYHVQTEDKGTNTPVIVSLVYTGGEILASKRSPYDDLIASGFSEAAFAERLKRQHRLICAAINAGRLEELKRLATPAAEQATPQATEKTAEPEAAGTEPVEDLPREEQPLIPPVVVQPAAKKPSPYTVYDPRHQSAAGQMVESEERLRISLPDQTEDFHSGDSLTLQILVTHRTRKGEKPINGAAVSLKVLGTAFRPLIYSVKTNREGVATVSTAIPEFTSGRAAILIRAEAGELSSETRRVIHPG